MFFYFQYCFSYPRFLFFYMKLKTVLSRSVNNCVGILMGIALNLQISFNKMVNFTIFILPHYEHGRSLHLSISSPISSFRDLKFLLYRAFTFLARVIARYFMFVWLCEEYCFSHFFLSLLIICIKEDNQFF